MKRRKQTRDQLSSIRAINENKMKAEAGKLYKYELTSLWPILFGIKDRFSSYKRLYDDGND